MLRRVLMLSSLLVVAVWVARAADKTAPQTASQNGQATLTADQVVQRNVAARGGLQAWRAVHTLVLSGKMEAGGNNRPSLATPGVKMGRNMPPPRPVEQVRLPFLMEMERPRKTRVEVQFKGQTAIQVFDGTSGWKLRPFLNRREVEPFTGEEMKTVAAQTELDGPLVDYAAKGTTIALLGMEKVEDRNMYKLQLTLKSGQKNMIWIDAETFLEAKMEGAPKLFDGTYHAVDVYYRDYRAVGALKVPFLLETRVLSVASGAEKHTQDVKEQVFIDKVEVNSKLDDGLFTKQQLVAAANAKPAVTAAKLPLR